MQCSQDQLFWRNMMLVSGDHHWRHLFTEHPYIALQRIQFIVTDIPAAVCTYAW